MLLTVERERKIGLWFVQNLKELFICKSTMCVNSKNINFDLVFVPIALHISLVAMQAKNQLR